MQPINYQIDVARPFETALKGYAGGAAIRDDQFKQQQQQTALAQQQQQQQVIRALITNPSPTAKDFADASLLVPGMREQFKQSWDMHSTEQQQSSLAEIGQVHSALTNGQPQYAADILNKRVKALENSGGPPDQIEAARNMAKVIEANPAFARAVTGMKLMSIPGGDKVIASLIAQGAEQRSADQAPADLLKKQADAQVAAAAAGNAPKKLSLENQTAEEKIITARDDRRIAQLDVEIKQANSETQRGQLVLERDKLIQARTEKAQAAGADQQGQMDTVQQALDTASKLMKDPLLDSSFGIGSAIGKLLSYVPGTENKDYRAKIDTLKAQIFIPAVAQLKAAGGSGGLSNAEGEKLDASIASLDADQSPKAFKNNLGVVLSLLTKHQQKILANSKLPTTGGGFVLNHPSFGKVTEGDINRLLQSNPGATREQVMQYLQSGGK